MKAHLRHAFLALFLLAAAATPAHAADETAAPLPAGVKAVWDLDRAARETTPTRERICINGLWRWQPAHIEFKAPPTKDWGYFKVPGCWPGRTDYDQKDSQTVFAHPSWKSDNLAGVTRAWYQREITIPATWSGRRIALSLEYLNSYATAFVDGQRAGEAQFPAGEVDLTSFCRPAEKHLLSLLVVALPLKAVLLSYHDTNSGREEPGNVARRGLCGDVYLVSMPSGPRIDDIKVETSVRKLRITVNAALNGLVADQHYVLHGKITSLGRIIEGIDSMPFSSADLTEGRFAFADSWIGGPLWDIDTPENKYDLSLSLLRTDAAGDKLLDSGYPVRFGFREFWIDGRDFYLNGTRIFLSAVPLDNAQIGAAQASYAAARETMLRLKSFGINFVYTHNYGCEPGDHLSFAEVLRAADDVGMLVSFSQPHFSHYDWDKPDADQNNGYARHAEFYVRAAQNHPAVVAYSMSHNGTGYDEDMNPDMIDGQEVPRDNWAKKNVQRALRAEAIISHFDPSRIVYHHASGNLGSMHDSNFYPNWAPIQELSDWFEHWSTKGIKPFFACEYGAPFSWDWAMYRGWYKGQRNWGSAKAPWEFCLAEWNSQFIGDQAFKISDGEKANLRWEAKQYRSTGSWFRWDYPQSLSSKVLEERYPIFAMYLTDNWRAFRTWGVSGISPWEHELYWKLRDGVDRGRKDLKVDWDNLQRPGFSADYLGDQYERMDLAFERTDWVPTVAAQALLRNNMPLLAYIGGKPDHFTSKDHVFYPGETVEKQIIIINNSRRTVTCDCEWSFGFVQPTDRGGKKGVRVPTGEQQRVPFRFELPKTLPPGRYDLFGTVTFDTGEIQGDLFSIRVVARPAPPEVSGKIALFDPHGETGKMLAEMGVATKPVMATDDLTKFDLLIVGKSALTVDGPAPRIDRVRGGLRVLLFEQSSEVLEKRFGFRVQEYGLRRVFPRVPDHPLLAGVGADVLSDWRGESTLLPSRLKYELRPQLGPVIQWAGITVPRVWRCGNRGDVASVLIEKPARGNFLPIVDGGFSLQYSPLMEYREGQGMVLFCQLDVTGRTEREPAAETLVGNMLRYVSAWKPAPVRAALYAGDPAGRDHLKAAGVSVSPYDGGALNTDQLLILGPGAGSKLKSSGPTIDNWLNAGGKLLAIGLDQQDLKAILQFHVRVKPAEHIATYFAPPAANSPLAGIGPADVHNRDPRELPLVTTGATHVGDGVLAQCDLRRNVDPDNGTRGGDEVLVQSQSSNAVFDQLVPWQFDAHQYHLKKTFRRASFTLSRLLGNLGVASATPLLARFETPVDPAKHEQRWLDGLYLDKPEEWDDPYRFFRW